MGRPPRCRSYPRDDRATARKTKTASRMCLREVPLCDTLLVVAVFQAPSRKGGVPFWAGRSFFRSRSRSFKCLDIGEPIANEARVEAQRLDESGAFTPFDCFNGCLPAFSNRFAA